MRTSQVRRTLLDAGKKTCVGNNGLPASQYEVTVCTRCNTFNILQISPEHEFVECLSCHRWIPLQRGVEDE